MTIGVILARFQPLHNGHVKLIEKALHDNDKVYIFIGSVDKFNKRNPIPKQIRYNLLVQSFEENEDFKNKCSVYYLEDLSDETNNNYEWGFYLYASIVSTINHPYFTIYYSDGYNIITSWFPKVILQEYVSLMLVARKTCEGGVSATQVRKAILEGKDEDLMSMVPTCVYCHRKELKQFIELSLEVQ